MQFYVFTDMFAPIKDKLWSKQKILIIVKALIKLISLYGFFRIQENMIREN
jgi:hypothetical protein